MMNTAEMTESNDASLVAESLTGNRDAFGRIVARYQALIASLAYSGTGNLSQSEDLAQETFIVAWKQLAGLREPQKLRSWLCGIARNLIYDAIRKQGREPSHAAAPLEAVEESPAPGPQPPDQTISNEEATILWRSLERIPETYREPLILFYREHQSIEAVAEKLELTQDNVKQRLSRGRKMLHQQVLAVVEGALERTSPGQAFTLSVLAALPAVSFSAKATVLGAAVKGGAVVKGVTLGSVLGILLGPVLGVLAGYFGVRASIKSVRTPRERSLMIRYGTKIVAAVVLFAVSIALFSFLPISIWRHHLVLSIALAVATILGYVVFVIAVALRFNRTFAQVRHEERQLHPELYRPEPVPLVWEYRSRATFLGLPLVHCRSGRKPGEKLRPAIGWIAYGEIAYGILFAGGAFAVGGISMGGASVGIFAFGGVSLGLLALGGFALGGVALGGAAVGLIASGGAALGWYAAQGGAAMAHELALGGATIARHANDPVAHEFFAHHYWLNISRGGPQAVFWTVCFAPIFAQVLVLNWWRKKTGKKQAAENSRD